MVATISNEAETMIKSREGYYLLSRDRSMPTWPSYTVKEAAKASGYNEEYIRRLIREEKIEAVMFGYMYLIKIESLENYIRQMEEADDARTGPKRKP